MAFPPQMTYISSFPTILHNTLCTHHHLSWLRKPFVASIQLHVVPTSPHPAGIPSVDWLSCILPLESAPCPGPASPNHSPEAYHPTLGMTPRVLEFEIK